MAVVSDVVIDNQIYLGVVFGNADISQFKGIYVEISRDDADGNRQLNIIFRAGVAARICFADHAGLAVVVLQQMKQAVMDILAAHGQLGRGTLFCTADDDGTGVSQVRVFNLGFLQKGVAQKILQAAGSQAASGKRDDSCAEQQFFHKTDRHFNFLLSA